MTDPLKIFCRSLKLNRHSFCLVLSMKKSILPACIFFALLISCNNNSETTSDSESNSDSKKEQSKKMSKRDLSISTANAYNNLFFDSTVMVKFFADDKTDEDLVRRMTSFYNTRNYQFAWFTDNGLTEQARGFWNMHNYQTTYANDSALKDKSLQTKMNAYVEEADGFNVGATDPAIIKTELKLTKHFIMYTLNNFEDGMVKRKEMERFVPRKKEDPVMLADSLISKKHKDEKYYADANTAYKLLKGELVKYVAIAKAGGWPTISVSAKQLKKGSSSPAILQLKKRLELTGDMPADTTAVYNETLEAGIKNIQLRFGYTPTGILTDPQLKDINVPAIDRVKQLLLNMGRMQWMVNEPKGQMIVVNIPEFVLHVKEGATKVFDMPVVVGKEAHSTMMFTGNLNQVVFSPYWNVPSSIVKNEILPSIQKNPNYLASQNMESTGNEGGLPVIRQLPGPKNSLGKVKFLFPNSFNIYFHDTPAKSLFSKDKRAYSHGCIRLSDPVKMATYLLKDQSEWTPEKIDEAMNSGNEKFVKLKNTVPVLITYYTAWVDEAGLLHFAEDIYGHDKILLAKMFN